MSTTTKPSEGAAHQRCPKCGNYNDSPTHKFCSQPSEGAVRAANAINMCEGDIYYEDDIETWAEIIDRETHAGEMLRLLELWDDMRLVEFDSNENTVLRLSPAKWHEVREVIRRARGGE